MGTKVSNVDSFNKKKTYRKKHFVSLLKVELWRSNFFLRFFIFCILAFQTVSITLTFVAVSSATSVANFAKNERKFGYQKFVISNIPFDFLFSIFDIQLATLLPTTPFCIVTMEIKQISPKWTLHNDYLVE